ncbi:MAG: hypothetical protein WAM91_17400 [Candidatus Acidiferrales bacterium]
MKQIERRGKRATGSAATVTGGARLFHRMYTRLGCQGRPPHFSVEYFPYANLVNTVRLREDSAYVRVSDILRDAPLQVMEAAAAVLLSRLYRQRAPRELLDLYRHFSTARGTHRKVLAIRSKRGTRVAGGPMGGAHNLAPMFLRLNRNYFSGRLHRPRLGWSKLKWRAQLGCFDPGLDQIVINTRLDGAGVPDYVVEYVLYHEMLHVRHPIRVASCGLQAHSADFRRAERQFKDYERARNFLERM